MSRQLFLFVSVASLAATTWFSSGVRSVELASFFRSEIHADITSIDEDVWIVRQQAAQLGQDLQSLWLDARSDAILLQADARFEAQRLTRPFINTDKDD